MVGRVFLRGLRAGRRAFPDPRSRAVVAGAAAPTRRRRRSADGVAGTVAGGDGRAGRGRALDAARSNAAADLVAAFFRAITLESGEALDRVLSSDASLESSSGRHPARSAWRSRFNQFDYSALRATPLYRAGDLETYRGNEQAALGLSRRLPPMQPEDVFIRVHLDVTHVNKTRLFADEIGFLLRPAGGGFRISTLSEDFQLL